MEGITKYRRSLQTTWASIGAQRECTRMTAPRDLTGGRPVGNPWSSPRSVLHLEQGRLPNHAPGAVHRQPLTWISGWRLGAGGRCRVGV